MRKLLLLAGLTTLLAGCNKKAPETPQAPLSATYKSEPLPGCKSLRDRGGSC